jgi:type VI protein secretion system component Hcp
LLGPITSPYECFAKVSSVSGPSADASHSGWFNVDALGYSITSPSTGGGAGTGGPAAWAFQTTLEVGAEAPVFYEAGVEGSDFAEVTVDCLVQGLVEDEILLTDVTVTSTATPTSTASSDGPFALTLGLSFGAITISYTPQNPDGTAGATVSTSYDVATNSGGGSAPGSLHFAVGAAAGGSIDPLASFSAPTEQSSSSGPTTFGPATLVQSYDDGDTVIAVSLVGDQAIVRTVEVDVPNASGLEQAEYLFDTVTFNQVVVSGLTPTIVLTPVQTTWSFTPENADGTAGATVSATSH